MAQEAQYLTPRQATEYLAERGLVVAEDTVRRWCRDDLIPALTLPGGQYRVHRMALDAILTGETPAKVPAPAAT
jgi:excisionase family DNA binding protein